MVSSKALLSEPTDEILEEIADAAWNKDGHNNYKNIHFNDIRRLNSYNYTYSGTIKIDTVYYGFVIEMGDRNGCVIKEWILEEELING